MDNHMFCTSNAFFIMKNTILWMNLRSVPDLLHESCALHSGRRKLWEKIIESHLNGQKNDFSYKWTAGRKLAIITERETLSLMPDHFVLWMFIIVWWLSCTTFTLDIVVVSTVDAHAHAHAHAHPRLALVNFTVGRVPVSGSVAGLTHWIHIESKHCTRVIQLSAFTEEELW